MRRVLVGAALALALTACGSAPTTATATIGDRDCEINPTQLDPGDVTFTINNTTDQRVPFVIKEDEDTNVVGQVDVPASGTATLTVHLDGSDVYRFHCGAVTGPEIDPGA